MARLDHLVVACTDLDTGSTWLAARLGVAPRPGGRHALMGTHNRLLSLGPEDYLELIAIDPEAPPPPHRRWFGLDGFAGVPRLVAWVAAVQHLTAPEGGTILDMARGDLRWRFAMPPADPAPGAPWLIEWQAGHPCRALPDDGLRLVRCEVASPLPGDPRVVAGPSLRATVRRADGAEVTL